MSLPLFLSQEHEIVVVAPNENKSASSSALTLDRALQPIEIKKNFYSVDASTIVDFIVVFKPSIVLLTYLESVILIFCFTFIYILSS
jgi:broad specificity polyphosphatase/5'/3'-nucleotidase SurE